MVVLVGAAPEVAVPKEDAERNSERSGDGQGATAVVPAQAVTDLTGFKARPFGDSLHGQALAADLCSDGMPVPYDRLTLGHH